MVITPRNMLLVFVGGVLGTALRWGVGEGVEVLGVATVVSLVVVNIVGSFALGWFVAGARSTGHHINALFAIGLLGSFTTFSGYAVVTVDMFQTGSPLGAVALAFGSIAAGYTAAVVGRLLGERR